MGAAVPFIGPAMQGAQAVGAGVSGKNAQRQADQRMGQFDQATNQILGMGMDAFGQAQDFMGGRAQQMGIGDDLLNQAMQGGAAYGNQMQNLAGQAQGAAGQYDFQPGSNLMNQTMDTFNQFAGNQRNMARDQAALAMTQGMGGMDAALADRGISRGSGVAAAGIGELAGQQAQQMAGLERGLSDQAGQMGLQGAQFDVQRMLQQQGMESQFALGQGQQRLQGIGMAGDMATQGYMNPLQMGQQMFQQNVMQPFMSTMQGMQGALGMGMNAMGQGIDTRRQQAAAGGAGKGAATGGLVQHGLPGMQSAKGK